MSPEIKELEKVFIEFDLTVAEVEEKMTEAELDDDMRSAVYSFYFAMASLVLSDSVNILELGTGWGRGVATLSRLFPSATVYTIDVLESDKIFSRTYSRRRRRGVDGFKENISRENVVFIESNTFFLPSLELPDKFDLIWIDGAHDFPAVAWDIMFAYNHMNDGGFMLMHDCEETRVKDVLGYIRSRIKEEIRLFPGGTACIIKGQEK